MKLNLTENDIYEAKFGKSFRGYNIDEVDEILNKIIEDYQTMQDRLEELESQQTTIISNKENVFAAPEQPEIKESELILNAKSTPVAKVEKKESPLSGFFNFDTDETSGDVNDLLEAAEVENRDLENTNYDFIKRLAQLEKEVAQLKK